VNPGHRPSVSALGYALPARWAGFVRRSYRRGSTGKLNSDIASLLRDTASLGSGRVRGLRQWEGALLTRRGSECTISSLRDQNPNVVVKNPDEERS
jgi:hypothetical protein